MSKLVVIEQYADYSAASSRAKELAVQFKERTGIQREDTGWAVLASQSVATAVAPPVEDQDSDYEHDDFSNDAYDDEYQKEVVQPLIEEFQSDQDSWARSEEEGWFYED